MRLSEALEHQRNLLGASPAAAFPSVLLQAVVLHQVLAHGPGHWLMIAHVSQLWKQVTSSLVSAMFAHCANAK
jgi:hypothetical protein